MSKNVGPITDLFQEYAAIDDFCLTKSGSLIGAVEITGRDPEGLTKDDFIALAMISRSIYLNLPDSVSTVTQYYLHSDSALVRLKERSHPISRILSQNRQDYLNAKQITSSKIVHFFEIEPDENLTDLSLAALFKHLFGALRGNRTSKTILCKYLSNTAAIIAYRQELEKQRSRLHDVLAEAQSRWDSLFPVRVITQNGLWAFLRFLANLDPGLLHDALTEKVPKEQWDLLACESDCFAVKLGNQDFLKFQGIENTYARILSVIRYGENIISPGIWSSDKNSVSRLGGNYLIMTRFSPLSRMQQSLMFGGKKRELERNNLSLAEILDVVNRGQAVNPDWHAGLKPAIREKMLDIEKAEALGERWGKAQAAVLVFGKDPDQINDTARRLRKGMLQAGISMVPESVNLPDAYRAMLPAGRMFSVREMDLNCSQFGAVSLIYRSSEGQVTVGDLGDEEAQYVFTCADGSLFHFSPFVGGRAVVICVGPIRTGKSFAKNTIASHFPKYGGFYRAIDIDPGTETLALFYQEDGAIFRIGHGNRGFNNFAIAAGDDDLSFVSHQKNLIMEMMRSNENQSLRTLAPHEQNQLDQAIFATLRLPRELRRFSAMVNHCPRELQQKLSRWHGNGMYAGLFDCSQDAVGALDRKVIAFNLAGVKDDAVQLPLAMSEITYRVTRMFEDPDFRSVPKFLDIDEAHALLRIKSMREYIIRNVRTWGKWMAGIGLWSQDPSEYRNIEDWTALRSAASTFLFMADPTADAALYKETFKVTDGEVEEIRSLRPKKEAYIIQRELGVSKKILVDVEPEQHCINTSRPDEAALRDRFIAQYGINQGLQKTIDALNLRHSRHTTKDQKRCER